MANSRTSQQIQQVVTLLQQEGMSATVGSFQIKWVLLGVLLGVLLVGRNHKTSQPLINWVFGEMALLQHTYHF